MSDRATVDFLTTVPLLEGREDAELVELARVMRRRRVLEGEILWSQGDDAREMVFIVEGAWWRSGGPVPVRWSARSRCSPAERTR